MSADATAERSVLEDFPAREDAFRGQAGSVGHAQEESMEGWFSQILRMTLCTAVLAIGLVLLFRLCFTRKTRRIKSRSAKKRPAVVGQNGLEQSTVEMFSVASQRQSNILFPGGCNADVSYGEFVISPSPNGDVRGSTILERRQRSPVSPIAMRLSEIKPPNRSRYAEEALASAKAAARMTPRSSHISPMSPSAGTAMTHQGVKFSLASTEPNLSIFGGVQTDAYDSSSGASWMNGGLGTGSAAPQQRNALEDSSRRSVDVSQSILHSMASPLQILHRGASLQDRVDDGFLGGSNHGIGRQQPSQSILHSSASPLQILHQGASLQDQIEDELLGSSNHGIGRQQHMHDDRIKERQHLDKRGRDEWLETSSQDGARARTRFASDKENASPFTPTLTAAAKMPRITQLAYEDTWDPSSLSSTPKSAHSRPQAQLGQKRSSSVLTPGANASAKRVRSANWLSPHAKRKMEGQAYSEARKQYRSERALATTHRDDTVFSNVPDSAPINSPPTKRLAPPQGQPPPLAPSTALPQPSGAPSASTTNGAAPAFSFSPTKPGALPSTGSGQVQAAGPSAGSFSFGLPAGTGVSSSAGTSSNAAVSSGGGFSFGGQSTASLSSGAQSQSSFSSSSAGSKSSVPITASTSAPAFGSTASSVAAPSFGFSPAPALPFGSVAPQPPAGSTAPGSVSAFGASTGSAFGASTGSAFGTSTGSAFGASTGSAFGASTGSAFGASTGSAFGASSGSGLQGSSFGSFGASAASNSSAPVPPSVPAFGSTAASFGSGFLGSSTAAPAVPSFGSTGGGFGALLTGSASAFGSSGSAPGAGTASFGAPSAFSSAPSFGSSGVVSSFGIATSFGSSGGATSFGSFGSAPSFGNATSFGSSGSAPSFGSFGSAPSFGSSGSAPSFGSAAPVFGSSGSALNASSGSAFGAAPTSSAGFGAAAPAGVSVFGALPQQQQQQQQNTTGFSFGGSQPTAIAATASFGVRGPLQSAAGGVGVQPQAASSSGGFGFGAQQQQPTASGSFAFGAPSQPAGGFGSVASTPAFGTSAPSALGAGGAAQGMFGAGAQGPAFGAGVGFGAGVSPFGGGNNEAAAATPKRVNSVGRGRGRGRGSGRGR